MIDTLTRIGKHHTNHCEDSCGNFQIDESRFLIAVSDGCSMGTESHFASTLFMKVLKEIAKVHYNLSFIGKSEPNIDGLLMVILKGLFNKVKMIRDTLQLDKYELLATLIVAVFDSKTKEVSVITIGDGLISIDDKIYEYDQSNRPDYVGYHLDEIFEDWFSDQRQILSTTFEKSISISSDGIFTFSDDFDEPVRNIRQRQIIADLMIRVNPDQRSIQNKMDGYLDNENLSTNDDVAVVSVCL
ncbi:protein phosphatase 2C domain-containing protein [Lewinella sp. 4G2]|uniref:protein phosphatase 2C domain-containing protein n=1 Tax=Lewinella sp. 4G2 TaxID=1803372 RepID=UPI001E5F8B2E|nr:protein phosphatase 2C domain-containing protein [Lewinella sp. 4G2]